MLEVESDHVQEIVEQFSKINNPAEIIGTVHKVYGPDANVCLGKFLSKKADLKIRPAENSDLFKREEDHMLFSSLNV